jgi:cytochrome c oxidase subunit 4
MEEDKLKTHTVSYKANIVIWLALLILTGFTIMVTGIDLGKLGIVTNILIASVKAAMVVYIFMHLKYESLILKLMLLMVVATLTIIIALTFLDIMYR